MAENVDVLTRRGLTIVPLPLYNWDTQEPQSFALSVTKNGDGVHVRGCIVEQSTFRPTNGLTNDERPAIVHNPAN